MPSSLHEVLVELFRGRPSLAAELLSEPFDVDVPTHGRVRIEAGDLADLVPTEYRADVVTVLDGARGDPVMAIVVEAQLRRDPDKQWTWPVYLATLRARLRCPAMLLVVCADAATAAWCAGPITLGHPGWALTPLVLGPDQIPVVTDPEHAGRSPELAVLSAIAHGGRAHGQAVLHALVNAFIAVDEEHVVLYSDAVLKALPDGPRHYLEALMTTGTYREYESDFVRRYVNQGRAEGEAVGEAKGEAKAVLTVLIARGFEVPADARARITDCTDLDQLELWVRRAATIDSIDELFD